MDLYEAGPGHRGSCSRTPRCRMSRNPVVARRRHKMHHAAAVGSLLSALQSVVLELGRAAYSLQSNQLHHSDSVHKSCLCRSHENTRPVLVKSRTCCLPVATLPAYMSISHRSNINAVGCSADSILCRLHELYIGPLDCVLWGLLGAPRTG